METIIKTNISMESKSICSNANNQNKPSYGLTGEEIDTKILKHNNRSLILEQKYEFRSKFKYK